MRRLLVVCGVLALIAPVFADTILPPGAGAFYAWNWGDVNQNGQPFWDGRSTDGGSSGSACGVGYYIRDRVIPSYCNATPVSGLGPGATLPYLGDATDGNKAPLAFYIGSTDPMDWVTLKLEVAAYNPKNVIGIYFTDGTSILGTQQLFSGPDHPVTTVSFLPAGRSFGFYLTSKENKTYYTQSNFNVSDPNKQHFALFRQNPVGTTGLEVTNYWLGIEDLDLGGSDRDYNDVVLHIRAVPEPATLVLFGVGLLALGAIKRRALPRLR